LDGRRAAVGSGCEAPTNVANGRVLKDWENDAEWAVCVDLVKRKGRAKRRTSAVGNRRRFDASSNSSISKLERIFKEKAAFLNFFGDFAKKKAPPSLTLGSTAAL